MSIASYNNLQMSLDSGSILPHSEPGIEHEAIVNTVSESVQEFAHPDDVAAMQAEWALACEEAEYLRAHQWSSAALQDVRNNQRSFPTLDQFTAPVADLPQFPSTDPSQYYSPQPPAVPQTLEGPAWSQPAHDGGSSSNGPDFSQNHFPTIVDLELWIAGDPRAYGPGPSPPQEQNAHFQAGMSIPSATEHTGYAYASVANTFLPPVSDSDAAMDLSDDNSLEPSSSAPNGTARVLRPRRKTRHAVESEDTPSSALNETARAKPPKRKTRHTVESEDSSSGSSLPPRKRRCLDDDEDEIKEGKFGAYRLANPSAVVMAVPVHDPKPVDISNRRTRDAYGKPLRTRRFGAMELDDSYTNRTVKIGNGLPAGMTCVRACDWTDQPCGLFLEMNKDRVSHHLFHWHGVRLKEKALCKFEDCLAPGKMRSLGRHIHGVHYTTALECPYCGKRSSRSDSLERHQKKCSPFLAEKARAKKGRRQFRPQDPKQLVYGYIVPARNAT